MNDTLLRTTVSVRIWDAVLPKYMDSFNRLAEYLDKNGRPSEPFDATTGSITPFESVWMYKGCAYSLCLRMFTYPKEKKSDTGIYRTPLPVSPEIEEDFVRCLQAETSVSAIFDILSNTSLEAIKKYLPSLYDAVMEEKRKSDEAEKPSPENPKNFRPLYERTEAFCKRLGLLSDDDLF